MIVTSRTDPRSEERITPFQIAPIEPDDLPPDFYLLLALGFALMAVLMKVRVYSWLVALLSFSSLANQRFSCIDFKTVSATFSLIMLTFISTHTQVDGQPVMAPMLPWLRK